MCNCGCNVVQLFEHIHDVNVLSSLNKAHQSREPNHNTFTHVVAAASGYNGQFARDSGMNILHYWNTKYSNNIFLYIAFTCCNDVQLDHGDHLDVYILINTIKYISQPILLIDLFKTHDTIDFLSTHKLIGFIIIATGFIGHQERQTAIDVISDFADMDDIWLHNIIITITSHASLYKDVDGVLQLLSIMLKNAK